MQRTFSTKKIVEKSSGASDRAEGEGGGRSPRRFFPEERGGRLQGKKKIAKFVKKWSAGLVRRPLFGGYAPPVCGVINDCL